MDGNGVFDPLTDGLLVLRFGFGFAGADSLTTGAVRGGLHALRSGVDHGLSAGPDLNGATSAGSGPHTSAATASSGRPSPRAATRRALSVWAPVTDTDQGARISVRPTRDPHPGQRAGYDSGAHRGREPPAPIDLLYHSASRQQPLARGGDR